METENDFLVKNPEKMLSARQYEWRELESDISVFTDEEAGIVRKFLAGDPMSADEQKIFDRARNSWWFNKYGFPHHLKPAREAVLLQKYASGLTNEGQERQLRLFKAFGQNDPSVTELRKEFRELFPGQQEGVSALFDFKDFLRNEKELIMIKGTRKRENNKEFEKLLESVAQ